MPHASTYIQITNLEFAGDMPLLSGVCRSCGWDVYGLDWNSHDFIAYIILIWKVRCGSVLQINKLAVN